MLTTLRSRVSSNLGSSNLSDVTVLVGTVPEDASKVRVTVTFDIPKEDLNNALQSDKAPERPSSRSGSGGSPQQGDNPSQSQEAVEVTPRS